MNISSYGVGITTLEEVFLKIGEHGEEDDEDSNGKTKEDENSDKKSKSSRDASADRELEEYTIVDTHETGAMNVFFIQFKALLKKKLLMQFRDLRTLIIELIFPIILIIVGLALAKI